VRAGLVRRMTAAAPGLRVEGVSVRFAGLTALDGVSLSAKPGQVLGVIGPNGAGKTTLFNAICGFVRPQGGTISWRGEALRRIRPHQLVKLGIARTVQGVRLFPHLTALENVMVGADHLHRPGLPFAFLGLPRSDRAERALRETASRALGELGVADVAARPASSLPYPIQKRISLARALVAKPDLLLLDEPAGGLGADDVDELAGLIRGLDKAMTVMLVEHRMDLVMSVCDHVAVLDSGRLIAEGSPDQIRANQSVLEAYLGTEEENGAGG
jgi:branched-chain amino acid transport system ATP-binding protein